MAVNPYIKKGLKTNDRITKYYLDDIETCLSDSVNAVNENTNDIDYIKVIIDNNTNSINELTTQQTETIRDLALGSFSKIINLEGLTIGNLVLSRSQVILGNITLS